MKLLNLNFSLCLSLTFLSSLNLEAISIKALMRDKCISVDQNGVLDLSNQNISSLKGIKEVPGVKKIKNLILSDNKIVDLSPLGGLGNIESLDICSNKIKNIRPLKELKNLRILFIEGNMLSDQELKDLSNLENLKKLYVDLNHRIKNSIYRHVTKKHRNTNYLKFVKSQKKTS